MSSVGNFSKIDFPKMSLTRGRFERQERRKMQCQKDLSERGHDAQPNDPSGNVHGGELMKMMDSTAYAAARKYCHANVVTARVDELEFHTPILIGDLVTCTAEVIYVGRSSMEVAVNVEVEVLEAEQEPQHALSAYFTMVALDRNGRPMAVPPMKLIGG